MRRRTMVENVRARRALAGFAALALAAGIETGGAQAQFFWDQPGPGGKAQPKPPKTRPAPQPEAGEGGEGGPMAPRPAPTARPGAAAQPIVLRKSVVAGLNIVEHAATLAEVSGLKGGKGSFLSLRIGPAASLKEIARLNQGQLMIPIMQGDPEWLGVIVAPPGARDAEAIAAACRVDEATAATLPEQSPYRGPCRSGWVARRWVKMVVD